MLTRPSVLKGILLGSGMALLSSCGGDNGSQAGDTSPDRFMLSPVEDVAPGSEVMSSKIIVSGIDKPTTISATGGSYAIDGGIFTASPGTVSNGQSVSVKVNAAAAINTPAEAVLTIGDASTKFVVTTAASLSIAPVPSSASSASPSLASSAPAPRSSSSAYSRSTTGSSAQGNIVITAPSNPAASSAGLSRSAAASSHARSSTPVGSANSRGPSSAMNSGRWQLNNAGSYLNFISAKNTHTLEVNHFNILEGDINGATARLVIDLNSVSSGITLRDQRLRDVLFQTTLFPTATATVTLPSGLLGSLMVGSEIMQEVTAELDLHGVKTSLATTLSVQRLNASRLVVQTVAPILLKPVDFALIEGIETLRAAVGIASISTAVPVDFTLVFDAR